MNEETIEAALKLVDRDRLESRVRDLAKAPRNAVSNPHHFQWARNHVADALRASGCGVTMQQFPCGNRTGINVIGSRPGSDIQLRPLLVSAHYDTTQDSPGADDNASGVAAMLECAAVLQGAPLKRPIEFVAFDMEEAQPEREGLVGSSAFVSYLEGIEGPPVFEGLFNLEMVGYTSGPGCQGHPPGFELVLPDAFAKVRERDFRGDFIAAVALGESAALSRAFVESAQTWTPELPVLPIEIAIPIPQLTDIFRSDHSPFWAAGIRAIMITDTADFRNPNYHQPTDTPDTLDYGFLTLAAKVLMAAVLDACL